MKRPMAEPLKKIEMCDPPPHRTKAKKPDRWAAFHRIMEEVRKAGGRNAKICHHPSREVVNTLKAKYPEFVFVSRKIEVGGKETFGIWARLILPPNEMPELPSENGLTTGAE